MSRLTDKSAATAAAQDDEEEEESEPFYNPEDAFGVIRLCCLNPLPRKVAPVGPGILRFPSEQALQVKYSPNGKYFAVALGDNCIDIYKHALVAFEDRPLKEEQIEKAKQKALGFSDEEIGMQPFFPYRRVGCCNDHSSAVQHFDFEISSSFIRSTSESNELLFCYVPSGRQNQSLKEMATKTWNTDHCILGWTVKSIWALGSGGGSDSINSVDKTQYKASESSFLLSFDSRHSFASMVSINSIDSLLCNSTIVLVTKYMCVGSPLGVCIWWRQSSTLSMSCGLYFSWNL